MLLQNQITESIKNVDEAPGQMQVPNEAIIVGLEGSLLSICATRGVKCTALMVPSLLNSPDPEGAAIILEALAKIPFRISIDTSRLREEAETVKKHLDEFRKMSQHQLMGHEGATSSDTEQIYK